MARDKITSTKQVPPLQFKSSFEQWVEKNLSDPNSLPAIRIGSYGLQNSDQVRQFLLTPAGKSVISNIGIQLAEKSLLEENLKLNAQEHELFMRRLMAAVFLAYLSEEDANADKIRREISELNTQILTSIQQKNSSTTSGKLNESPMDGWEMSKEYEQVLSDIQENIIEREQTEYQLAVHSHLKDLMEFKYALFTAALEMFDDEDSYLEIVEDFSLEALQERVAFYEKDVKWLENKIQGLGTQNQQNPSYEKDLMDSKLRLSVLRDLIQINKGEKHYVDAKGTRVSTIRGAALILDAGQKVVHDNGVHYILEAGQELADITSVQKESARLKYETAYNQMPRFKLIAAMHKLDIQMASGAIAFATLAEDQARSNRKDHRGTHHVDDELIQIKDQNVQFNLQKAQLEDMFAVMQGLKYFVNELGKTVAYGEQAKFILRHDQQPFFVGQQMYPISKNQQVLQHDGKYYLVKEGQTWDSIRDKPEELQRANNAFERLKYDPAMVVKGLVKHNNVLEGQFVVGEIQKYQAKLDNNIQQGVSLMRALHTPQMRPSPGSSQTTTTQDYSSAYKKNVRQQTEQSALTYDILFKCQGQLQQDDISRYQDLLNKAPRFGPLPVDLQKQITQFLEKRGVNPWSPVFNPTPYDGRL